MTGMTGRLLMLGLFALPPALPAAALPTGGQVVAGSGTISTTGNTLTVQQTSNRLVADWQSFDVASGHVVDFIQPGSGAIALNRVLGSNPSRIFGSIEANGQVFLVNPSGILFGAGASVDVGGLVASTLNIGDSNFLAGNYRFTGNGSNASVVNQGSLVAADGGYVALLGGTVDNQGLIRADLGSVDLAAGGGFTLDFAGDGLLGLTVDRPTANALVQNGQLIRANGGSVLLTASATDAALQTVVNNSGVIQAQTLQDRAGRILLLGGDSGTVQVGGTLDASAPAGGNGGQVETSGANVVVADGTRVVTLAPQGSAGDWLIDPQNFTVAASGGDMTGATLGSNLGSGNVTLLSSSGGTAGSGNININDVVNWSANTLTLTVANNVNINAVMTASGSAGLALNPATANGSDAAVTGGTVNVAMGAGRVDFTGGSNSLSINGTSYTILTAPGVAGDSSTTTLQGMANNLTGHYALGANIDASSTSGWNSGAGFTPVGGSSTAFSGVFDGLGHTVSGLYINGSLDDTGLFGATGGTAVVRNIGMLGGSTNSSIATNGYVGSLVGVNGGLLSNVYATTTVSVAGGYSYTFGAGGLVGENAGTIANSYATGNISGGIDSLVGGLVGWNPGGTITNSYATGSTVGYNAGGIVGILTGGNISNVFASGAVSGAVVGAAHGGLFGQSSSGTVTNAYWDTTTTGQSASTGGGTNVGGTGLTTTQLEAALPTGFSSSVWGNANNQATPYLLNNPGPAYIVNDSSNTLYTMILSATRLQAMSSNLAGHYALANSIDASATSGWNGGAGFTPIGNGAANFTGVFDGLGYTINGLYINNASASDVGLFGAAGSGSTIRNIGLLNANVTASSSNNDVGALIGLGYGTVTNAYSTGTVTGMRVGGLMGYSAGTLNNDWSSANVTASGTGWAGGLVAFNASGGVMTNDWATGTVSGTYAGGLLSGNNGGSVSNSYATGNVSGTFAGGLLDANNTGGTITGSWSSGAVSGIYAGGLTYLNSGALTNVYATGAVSGTNYSGGLVGNNQSGASVTNAFSLGTVGGTAATKGGLVASNAGTVSNGYWDTTSSGQSTSAAGTGLTTTQLEAALPTGFASSTWGNAGNQSTPYLSGNPGPAFIISDSSNTLYTIILNATQLQAMGSNLAGKYALGSNIDASATGGWNAGAGFVPVGNNTSNFTGTLDGLGFTINNLVVNDNATQYAGLFGATGSGAVLRNFGMLGGGVSDGIDSAYVGEVAGYNGGTITGVYVTGSATGSSNARVGDVTGFNGGTISYTWASGNVGDSSGGISYRLAMMGGLAGVNSGTISNSYATGNLAEGFAYNAFFDAGGLVGVNNATGVLTNVYAIGSVSSGVGSSVGGLVGVNNTGGTLGNAYWDTQTTGQGASSGGGTGLTTAQLEAALPTGFSSATWGNAANQSTPYLLNNTGPVLVSTDSSTTLYRIVLNVNQLQAMANNLAGNYALGNNIDASATSGWNGGAGFVPVGNRNTTGSYSGIFDGLGFSISGLTVNASSYAGLFGSTASSAILRNVGIQGGTISSGSGVGALVGDNFGTVSNAWSTASVSGSSFVGGLVGQNEYSATISGAWASGSVAAGGQYAGGLTSLNNGTITNSWASGNVSGSNNVGGLVGENLNFSSPGAISNSYATGSATASAGAAGGLTGRNVSGTLSNDWASGSASGTYAGGIAGLNMSSGVITNSYSTGAVTASTYGGGAVGYNSASTISGVFSTGTVGGTGTLGGMTAFNSGTVSSAYWDTTSSGTATSAAGTGLTTTQLEAALPTGFSSSVWGNANNQSTPFLLGNAGPAFIANDSSNTLYTIILNVNQLQAMNNNLAGNYALGGNIDASGTGGWNSGAGFVPVGNTSTLFTGVFDGLGFTVSGLTVNSAATYIGLFGDTAAGSILRNATLTNETVAGTDPGGLAGQNNGTISNVSVAGNISGSGAGGVVGWNVGTLTASSSSANVSGYRTMGGLVGQNNGTVSDSYATGAVSGSIQVAGLVGYNGGTIGNSYATGTVTGSTGAYYVGGLVGVNAGPVSNSYSVGAVSSGSSSTGVYGLTGYNSGAVSGSYWDTTTSGQSTSPAGTGLSTAQMQQASSFSGWSIDSAGGAATTWRIYNGYTYPLLTSFMTALTLTGNAKSVVYTGSTGFALGFGDFSASGAYNPALILGSASYTAGSKNVGSYSGGTLTLSNAYYSTQQGYDLIVQMGSLNITPATLTLSGLSASNKVYDATKTASATAGLTGVIAGDTVNDTLSATFSDKNVANGKTVTVNGITLGGADAGNYTIATGETTTANITPASLTLSGLSASNKVYNATNTASATAGLTGVIVGDTVNDTLSATFSDKNVANGKTVTVNGITLSGADAGNYTIATGETTTANITPASLTLSGLSANNKVYDATSTASATAGLTGVIAGDTVNDTLSATFSDKNVANGKTVTVNGITLSGTDAGNYSIATGETTTANITPASLTLSGLSASNKVYDATSTASATAGLTGVIAGDTVNDTLSATFSDKNVANGKTVTVNGITLGGADAGNYSIATGETMTANITPATLTLSGLSASNKVYDATSTASATAGLSGVIAGDTVNDTLSATFSDKNVANGKTVTVNGITLGGADAGNYSIATGETTTANITPASLTVSATGINKVYDGGTVASVTLSSNVIAGDTVTLSDSSAAFGDKNVGTGKTVSVTGIGIGGADAGNYTLANGSTSTTANITPATLTVHVGGDKVYNGSASLPNPQFSLGGLVTGDQVTVSGTASFSAPAGYGLTITASGLALSGVGAGNYVLASTSATGLGNITPAPWEDGAIGSAGAAPAAGAAAALAALQAGQIPDFTMLAYGNDDPLYEIRHGGVKLP